MDRLSIVACVAAVALAGGCDQNSKSSKASRERANAVTVSAKNRPDPAAMCDKHYPASSAPTYQPPELVGTQAPAKPGTWRWVNVWASWCKPCVEEMTRLKRWTKRLHQSGTNVQLVLISADASAEDEAKFRKQHPDTPPGARLAKPDGVAEWIAKLGVKGASLPVHMFVDPAGKVRCVRASAVQSTDYAAVAALLGSR